jgi:hypothetical protein
MELALIGYLLLKYGLKVTNKSIYPMHVYQNIPAGLDIFDVQSHGELEGNMIGKIHLIRRANIHRNSTTADNFTESKLC